VAQGAAWSSCSLIGSGGDLAGGRAGVAGRVPGAGAKSRMRSHEA
jgi:hypothetical protein